MLYICADKYEFNSVLANQLPKNNDAIRAHTHHTQPYTGNMFC